MNEEEEEDDEDDYINDSGVFSHFQHAQLIDSCLRRLG